MLERVESLMRQFVDDLSDRYISELFENLPHGKRLRAKLVLKIAGTGDDALRLAAIIEMIHAASLLHDDVIDDAMVRRAKGFEELTGFERRVASKIASAVTQLSIGEMADVRLSKSFHADEEAYMRMIYQKTAALIEATAASAAMLAGKDAHIYGVYGRNLGIAFQIVDDILDKKLSEEEKGWIRAMMDETGALKKAYLYAKELGDEAVSLMEGAGEASLADIVTAMIERDF